MRKVIFQLINFFVHGLTLNRGGVSRLVNFLLRDVALSNAAMVKVLLPNNSPHWERLIIIALYGMRYFLGKDVPRTAQVIIPTYELNEGNIKL